MGRTVGSFAVDQCEWGVVAGGRNEGATIPCGARLRVPAIVEYESTRIEKIVSLSSCFELLVEAMEGLAGDVAAAGMRKYASGEDGPPGEYAGDDKSLSTKKKGRTKNLRAFRVVLL